MDYYKKKRLGNIFLAILFVVGIILQFYGHNTVGYKGLAIQFVSLFFLIAVLFIYNSRHKK